MNRMAPGGGGRFAKMQRHMAAEGVDNPGAAAAAVGIKKYGAARMARMAAVGRKRSLLSKGK